MSKRHRFLLLKDLSWWWFNVLTFGLQPDEEEGRTQKSELRKACLLIEEMIQVAQDWAKASWSLLDDEDVKASANTDEDIG